MPHGMVSLIGVGIALVTRGSIPVHARASVSDRSKSSITIPLSEAAFYVGTYTSPGGSEGVYRAKINLSNGKISQPVLVAKTDSPSYVALNTSADRLYVANEATRPTVSAFAVEVGGALKPLNVADIDGADPCFLSVDRKTKSLLVASYTGGTLSSIRLLSDGSLGKTLTVFHGTGSGPNKERQDHSHMHWVSADPKSSFVYSCDLGTDKVQVYIDKSGELTELPKQAGETTPGGGPRHGAFHPSLPVLYVNNEMGGSVSVFALDRMTGGLSRIQTLSTLPNGVSTVGNTTAEIVIHPNHKWLFVSNRGNDSIASYKIEKDGKLALVQIVSAGVKTPRGFALDPTGKWLVVAGQASNDIVEMKVDPTTGQLSGGDYKVSLSKPVCIVFGR